MNMKFALAAILFTSPIVAENEASYFYSNEFNTLTSETFDITDLDSSVLNATRYTDPLTDVSPSDILGTLDETSIIIDHIIAIGEKIWKIIERNKPVVTQTYQTASLLPEGVKNWTQLSGWKVPETRVYKTVYKNGYGMEVAEFNYRVAFTPGGTVNGKGQYLARVEIEPAVLNVAWGYKFNASGEILSVTNAGTSKEPIAAMELRMNWSVDTVIRHMQESTRFYVRGDGLFKNLSDGSMPNQ